MKLLWAPWRIEYIIRPREEECIFCIFPKEDNDRENLIVYRGDKCFIIMNKYPYNNGHMMIVPYRHISSPLELEEEEMLECMRLINLSIELLDGVMKPHGYNIGINIGKAAGAGIEDHYHIHVVPRWLGDTNFMPIIGDTKVIVEAVRETYDKLMKFLKKSGL
jgi:ATP adenylyltransferase